MDLVYYGNQQELEYDFVVAPGASPSKIRLAFKGAEEVSISEEGDLILRTGGGEVRQRKPFIYQEVAGERREIAGRYAKTGDVKKIIVVQTNPGYGPSPGHWGTGQVVAVLCSSP